MNTLRRTLHPEIRVLDSKLGLMEYVASDETLDAYREVIKASGWRFDLFKKNSPFVDSHNYNSIECCLGKVVDFKVAGKRLVETVKWAIDVDTNTLAVHGFAMASQGYLPAVSVGFMPVRVASRFDQDPGTYNQQLGLLGLKPDDAACPRVIYLEQQQIELSACIIGANPNALAKAYKAGVIGDGFLDFLTTEQTKRTTDLPAMDAAEAERSRQRQRTAFLERFNTALKKQ